MAAALWLGVLGELEVRRNGARLALPKGRRRVVLAALLVRLGRPVSVGALVEVGWGDDVPHDPDGAVRTVISRLRALLGTDAVATTAEGYRLDVAPETCDAVRFEVLSRRAHDLPVAAAADVLDDALTLWRGSPYGELAAYDFIRAEAARLEQLRQTTSEERARLALELDEPEEAVARLTSLVAEEPLQEQPLALLAEALYHSGRAAEALEHLRHHRTLLAEELGLDPTPAVGGLEQQILRHALPRPRLPSMLGDGVGSLAEAATFVGREEDFTWLVRHLRSFRLVCVTGTGGVGKSRLVAEVLARTSRRGEPSVVVPLGAITRGEVYSTTASAIDMDRSLDPVPENLAEALSGSQLTLVFDNCEHVLDEVKRLVQAITRECPRVHVVATSRVRLGLLEEQVLPLDPFVAPEPGESPQTLRGSAAVDLFLTRLRRVRPQVPATDEVVRQSAQICRLLDGLPLAIELAAAKAGALGIAPTLERLDTGLELLSTATGQGDDGLRSVINWSYQLLDESDRALLAALSVFSGTFDLDAAQRVAPSADAARCPQAIARLVDASLVAVVSDAEPTRYRLLRLIREFAQEKLAESGKTETVRAAAAEWARDLAWDCGRRVSGPQGSDSMHRLDRNESILINGMRWALEQGRVDLATQTVGALTLCDHWQPGTVLLELIEQTARQPATPQTAGAALAFAGAATAAAGRGQLQEAFTLGQRARELSRTPEEKAMALVAMGVTSVYRGEPDRARRLWKELAAAAEVPSAYRSDGYAVLALLSTFSRDVPCARDEVSAALEAAQDSGSEVALAFARYAAGEEILGEDQTAAIPLLTSAVEAADRVGAAQIGLVARIALLSALTREDRLVEAVDLGASLLQQQQLGGRWATLWNTLRILAELLARLGNNDEAALLLAAAEQARTAPVPFGHDADRYQRLREDLGQVLGRERLARLTGTARSLPRDEVCRLAAAALSDARPPPRR